MKKNIRLGAAVVALLMLFAASGTFASDKREYKIPEPSDTVFIDLHRYDKTGFIRVYPSGKASLVPFDSETGTEEQMTTNEVVDFEKLHEQLRELILVEPNSGEDNKVMFYSNSEHSGRNIYLSKAQTWIIDRLFDLLENEEKEWVCTMGLCMHKHTD